MDVQEKRFLLEIGKTAKDSIKENSIHGIAGPVMPLTMVAKTVKMDFSEDDLNALPGRGKGRDGFSLE